MNHKSQANKSKAEAFPEEMRILEALLFASDEILSTAKLKTILPGEPDARQIRRLVNDLNAMLQTQRHPFEIVELGGGYQFRTVAYYHPWVRQLLKEKTTKKLSIQGLECLAIIAYKQPITKAEIESIRGVLSDGAMKTLLERRMVTPVGRSEKAGRPLLYGTTREFLEYFGINKLTDLPRIEEFEAIAKEKMEELSSEELSAIEQIPEESKKSDDQEESQNANPDTAGEEENTNVPESDKPVEPAEKGKESTQNLTDNSEESPDSNGSDEEPASQESESAEGSGEETETMDPEEEAPDTDMQEKTIEEAAEEDSEDKEPEKVESPDDAAEDSDEKSIVATDGSDDSSTETFVEEAEDNSEEVDLPGDSEEIQK